jgi:thiamine-phosphate pyrophosphorylase
VVEGGATLVQLRDKTGNTRRLIEEARAVRAALTGLTAPFLVNDRADVALAVKADGMHIGWMISRRPTRGLLLGTNRIIGLSIKTLRQAEEAPLDHLDYVCIGGVYQTLSKDNPDPPIGTEGLRAIAVAVRKRAPSLPIGAIAGIDESNAPEAVVRRRRRRRGDLGAVDGEGSEGGGARQCAPVDAALKKRGAA